MISKILSTEGLHYEAAFTESLVIVVLGGYQLLISHELHALSRHEASHSG